MLLEEEEGERGMRSKHWRERDKTVEGYGTAGNLL